MKWFAGCCCFYQNSVFMYMKLHFHQVLCLLSPFRVFVRHSQNPCSELKYTTYHYPELLLGEKKYKKMKETLFIFLLLEKGGWWGGGGGGGGWKSFFLLSTITQQCFSLEIVMQQMPTNILFCNKSNYPCWMQLWLWQSQLIPCSITKIQFIQIIFFCFFGVGWGWGVGGDVIYCFLLKQKLLFSSLNGRKKMLYLHSAE